MNFRKKVVALAAAVICCTSVGLLTCSAQSVGNFALSAVVTDTVNGLSAEIDDAAQYTGGGVCPAVTVKFGENVLTENADYILTYTNNKTIGNANCKIIGIGSYSGEINLPFTITQNDLSDDRASIPYLNYTYTGSQICPEPTLKINGIKLVKGTDYAVSYSNNKNVTGSAKITITGKENYTGTTVRYFNIKQNDISDNKASIPYLTYTYSGSAICPTPTLKINGIKLIKGTDYTVSYSNNKNVTGSAKITITGKGNYTGTTVRYFNIKQNDISDNKASIPYLNYTYTGSARCPEPALKVNGIKLTKGTDYTVSYKNNTSIGKAYVTLTGKGNFKGTTTRYFYVKPKKVTNFAGSVTTSSVKLTWSKVSNCTGYQIFRYNSSTGEYTKIKTITSNSTLSYTNSSLKSGTTYKYKIRSYKVVSSTSYVGAFGDILSKKTSTASTPVGKHGQLKVSGANIVDKNGDKFQIIGMSTHGIMWEDYSDILTTASLKVLRDDWGVNTIRIAMYTQEYGGYTTGSSFASQAKAKVATGVKNATSLGMYAIIDWHILSDGNPQTHQSEATAFFTDMAKTYADSNNVIYEICNEPNGSVTWSGNIKSYCEAVVKAIRKYDSDAIIVCGTGTWSQDIDDVVDNKLSDKNCVYALHFYANTHTDWLRDRVSSCYSSGLPIIVSEFGTCDASGNGGFNSAQTKLWINLLNSKNIGYINWSASSKSETASAFIAGTNLTAIKSGTSQLTESGKLIRSLYRARAGLS